MAYDEPLGLYGASAVARPSGSTYWKATCPLANSSRAKFFAHDELAFAVADSDRVDVAQAKSPRATGS